MTMENLTSHTSVAAIKQRAIEWLERSERSDFSAADSDVLEQWLSESPGHRVAFWHAKSAWERAGRLGILKAPSPVVRRSPSRFWIALASSAAIVIAVAGIGTVWLKGDNERVLSTGRGESEIVSLDDGSKIELNTDTEVRIGSELGRRTATLVRGEAYFQIVHDASRPFVVHAAGHRVLDLGTKFLVRESAKKLEVSLVEGRAQIDAADPSGHQRPAILTPGDVAVATADSLSVTRKPAPVLADALGWRRGVLIFHYVTLAEAVATFNRYNHEQLVITDPSIGRMTVLGTFPVNDVAAFARVAKNVFGLNVSRRESDILISR